MLFKGKKHANMARTALLAILAAGSSPLLRSTSCPLHRYHRCRSRGARQRHGSGVRLF
jgi:hypothetical protein